MLPSAQDGLHGITGLFKVFKNISPHLRCSHTLSEESFIAVVEALEK
jgi:hypothetical protein